MSCSFGNFSASFLLEKTCLGHPVTQDWASRRAIILARINVRRQAILLNNVYYLGISELMSRTVSSENGQRSRSFSVGLRVGTPMELPG